VDRRASLAPAAALFQRVIEQPVRQRADQPRALRDRDEVRRREQTATRVPPAHQHFAARHQATLHVQLRLVVQFQLVPLDRAAQFDDE
jgi:hypothetical protein